MCPYYLDGDLSDPARSKRRRFGDTRNILLATVQFSRSAESQGWELHPRRSLKTQQRYASVMRRSFVRSTFLWPACLTQSSGRSEDRKPEMRFSPVPPDVRGLPRKEVIQPQLPLRLPCYDFTPVTSPTFGGCLP
jgi:hypothetical protein